MFSLRDYQVPHCERIFASLKKRKYALDASDTGTGKTYVALECCKRLGVVPLVVGPKAARGGWEAAAAAAKHDIEFVGYEKLRGVRRKETGVTESEWLIEKPWGKGSFLSWKNPPCMVIFDEVHRCGGATSLNSKALIAAKRQSEFVLALSATAADDPRQMKALGYTLGLHGLSKRTPVNPDYMGWLLRHGCTPGWAGGFDFSPNTEKGQKAFERMHEEIFSPGKGSRMRKAEIPGFPQTTLDTLLLSPTDGANEIAEELHRINEMGHSGLAEAIACRQNLEELKVPFLIDLAADYALTTKVVIFVNFTATLQRLLRDLPEALPGDGLVGAIHGGQTDRERFATMTDFQQNKLDALVVNLQAGSESFNAHDPTGQIGRTALICPCDSGRRYGQVVGRVNRDGGAWSQQFVVFFKGTYEEKVAERMQAKGMNISLLNDADCLV
jgi:superfamily II DNA or RNA helicase